MVYLPDFIVPRPRHFGLSIGKNFLRGVESIKNGSPKTGEVVVPEDTFVDGTLAKKEQLKSALQELLNIGKFTTSYAAVCIPEIYIYSREYHLPIIDEADILEAVSWHLKDLFPFPASEIYFDWKIFAKDHAQYHIVVMAAQKQIIDDLINVLIEARIKPLSIEPGAAAITRFLVLKPETQVIVLEVNRRGAFVTFVDEEKVFFTTVVNYTPDDTDSTYLTNILETINEIVAFYEKKDIIRQKQNLQVILTGELSTQSWVDWAKSHLAFPVTALTTPITNPAFNKAYIMATSTISSTYDAHSINLLPMFIQKTYDDEHRQLLYQGLMMRFIAGMAFFLMLSGAVLTIISWKKQVLERDVQRLTTITQREKVATQQVLFLNAWSKAIVELAPLRRTPKDTIATMTNLLPYGIGISGWEYNDSKLQYTLHGIADSREILLLFKDKLEVSEVFTKVSLPLGSLETPENIKFTLSFIVK